MSVNGFFARLFHNDVAVDLGTMNTLIYIRGKGVVLEEPTVIAVNSNDEVLAVGSEAKDMLGSNPGNIRAIRPMRNGAINDPFVTDKMLEKFLAKIDSPFCLMRPRVVVAVPAGITRVLRKAVEESFLRAGARVVRLVEEPFAAAVGAGLPVASSIGSMIVDIGGGTSEIAIVALGNMVHCNSVNTAGDAFDEAITTYMNQQHNLSIGELTAERIKIKIGSAVPFSVFGEQEQEMEVSGLKIAARGNNLPGSVKVTSEEIRQALNEPINRIIEGVNRTLSVARPELAGNLVLNGMTITGGSSRLRGLNQRLSDFFKMPVNTIENPMQSVIMGIGNIMEKSNIFDLPQADPVGVNVLS